MKDISSNTFDESTNTAMNAEADDSKLPYVSPSPGEFPIIGSTICVDLYNPAREEFATARECGFSAGSSQVHYSKDVSEISSNDLTAKFKPAMLNTGINLIVSNDSIIGSYDEKIYNNPFDDPSVAASYKIRMNYTIQQSFVTGISVLDEPKWVELVASGDPLEGSYTPGPKTKVYRHSRDVMSAGCTAMNLPKRQMRANLQQAKRDKDETMNPIFGPLENYYEYLRAVQVLIQPQCWSFDLYPGNIEANAFGYGDNLKNLYGYYDRFLQISKEHDRPFRFFCLTTEFENNTGNRQASPNINRLRFETFTALAYGAQEIQYWTYCNRSSNTSEFYISSPINQLGVKNQIWYSLQRVNEEIRRFQKVFMGCRVQHIEHIDNGYKTPLKTEMGKVPEFYNDFADAPIDKIEVTEKFKVNNEDEDSIIFKGVMVSYITTDPDDLSTGYVNNDNASSIQDRTEHYAIIVSHDPDNYKTLTISFKNDFEITELTPRILTEGMATSPVTIVRELMPGGYLIFRYKKLK